MLNTCFTQNLVRLKDATIIMRIINYITAANPMVKIVLVHIISVSAVNTLKYSH